MKLSSLILLITLSLLIAAMVGSNILLKKEYDKIDKSDAYWNYDKILQQPFSHLKINGGNFTNITFEQNDRSSVSVLKNWKGFDNKLVKALVKNDTLFVNIPATINDANERDYLQRVTVVRICSPTLLSIDGTNTRMDIIKLQQKNFSVHSSGNSSMVIQSYLHDFDKINVIQQDSSKVFFQMSPDVKTFSSKYITLQNWDMMHVALVSASVSGISILDLGHARIDSLKLHVADSSSIILSGQGIRSLKQ